MEDIRDDIEGKHESEETKESGEIQLVEKEESALQDIGVGVESAVDNVKGKIMGGALTKVDNVRSIDNHAGKLAKVANDAIKADIEKENLKVRRTNAENKAEKQKIKNELISLRTEAKRLKREHNQILKEQKEEHKKRNRDILWKTYENKLNKMGYSYVPNKFILSMLLFFDGVVGFFEGVGKTSTAIMKALKWILIIGGITIVLMLVPASRVWLLSILGFIG